MFLHSLPDRSFSCSDWRNFCPLISNVPFGLERAQNILDLSTFIWTGAKLLRKTAENRAAMNRAKAIMGLMRSGPDRSQIRLDGDVS